MTTVVAAVPPDGINPEVRQRVLDMLEESARREAAHGGCPEDRGTWCGDLRMNHSFGV